MKTYAFWVASHSNIIVTRSVCSLYGLGTVSLLRTNRKYLTTWSRVLHLYFHSEMKASLLLLTSDDTRVSQLRVKLILLFIFLAFLTRLEVLLVSCRIPRPASISFQYILFYPTLSYSQSRTTKNFIS
jgi:hypothetical protein